MSNVQIIIPMSGHGKRFQRAGYTIPKPLIKVGGKPIIAHIIDMFPNEVDFIFICNKDHLDNKKIEMNYQINKYCPTAKIISIESHNKGPVYAVKKAFKYISNNKQIILNYCDFTCYWDWNHFKKNIISNKSISGAIPCYKGFHPHSLGKTNYAYVKENNFLLQNIQEKKPFTHNKMLEFASSGTYYFKNGKLMKEALTNLIKNKNSINGEYYVSLAYKEKPLFQKRIVIYPLQHFMQWGTPEDLKEYKKWDSIFKKLLIKNYSHKINHNVIIPMAGKGKRFLDDGYKQMKPLIEVSGKPMIIQAKNFLPKANNYLYVTRNKTNDFKKFLPNKNNFYLNLNEVTEGQACTAFLGLKKLKNKIKINITPITFGACDLGVIYDQDKFNKAFENEKNDIIVWTKKTNYKNVNSPNMYGWIYEKKNIVKKVLVKSHFNYLNNTSIITGIFTFKNVEIFENCYNHLIDRNKRINNEFYLDSILEDALQLGYNCFSFNVDHYISWGTPNELKTFQYWQSCFHKWENHKYNFKKDPFSAKHSECINEFYKEL